jgi:hypothetical protein
MTTPIGGPGGTLGFSSAGCGFATWSRGSRLSRFSRFSRGTGTGTGIGTCAGSEDDFCRGMAVAAEAGDDDGAAARCGFGTGCGGVAAIGAAGGGASLAAASGSTSGARPVHHA